MNSSIPCPHCGQPQEIYRNPVPTVDVVIYNKNREVVPIKRRNPPYGWALPGGFVDYGESVEQAAQREALEETGLKLDLNALLGVYSHPERDPRKHTLSVVFVASLQGKATLRAGDDAGEAQLFSLEQLPDLAFDHRQILEDFKSWLNSSNQSQGRVTSGHSNC